eukprot:gene31371-6530_t
MVPTSLLVALVVLQGLTIAPWARIPRPCKHCQNRPNHFHYWEVDPPYPPPPEELSPPVAVDSPPPVVELSPPPVVVDSSPPLVKPSSPPVMVDSPPPLVELSPSPVVINSPPPVMVDSSPPLVELSSPPVVVDSPPPLVELSPPPVSFNSPLAVVDVSPSPVLHPSPPPLLVLPSASTADQAIGTSSPPTPAHLSLPPADASSPPELEVYPLPMYPPPVYPPPATSCKHCMTYKIDAQSTTPMAATACGDLAAFFNADSDLKNSGSNTKFVCSTGPKLEELDGKLYEMVEVCADPTIVDEAFLDLWSSYYLDGADFMLLRIASTLGGDEAAYKCSSFFSVQGCDTSSQAQFQCQYSRICRRNCFWIPYRPPPPVAVTASGFHTAPPHVQQ